MRSGLRSWTRARWLVAAGAAIAAGLATGIPTDVVPTPIYRRMTPVTWWDYPLWAASALLVGLVAATYVRSRSERSGGPAGAAAVGGGALSFVAVGCPICNKLVVAALGVSGALSYFGPAQPFIGVASLLLLGVALAVRLRDPAACPVAPEPARS